MNPVLKSNLRMAFYALLGVFATIGITRMSFGMVLPLLQKNFHFSATEVGFIGTANFIGYFIGVFFVNYFYHKIKLPKLILIFISIQSMLMLMMVLSHHYLVIAGFYLLVGSMSAIGYMSIMSYITHHASPEYKGRVLGIAISGGSIGILFSGFSVYTLGVFDNYQFADNWIIFAITTFTIGIILSVLIKDKNKQHVQQTSLGLSSKFILSKISFWKMASIYLIFGISYTMFITYFVSGIIENWQVSIASSSNFWMILGFVALFSGPLFGFFADKVGVYKTLVVAYGLQSLACLLLIFNIQNSIVIYVSAFCFGISMWAVPSLMFVLSAQYFGAKNAAKPVALVTLVFAIGQIIGPISGGYIYDITHTYSNVFLFGFIISTIAMTLSFIYSKQIKNKPKLKLVKA